MHTASWRPEARPEYLQRQKKKKAAVCLKFGVQKKIHLTFIHQWVAHTDNCGGDGHTRTDALAHTPLSGPKCDSLFFSPTHPFETAQAHYALLYISLFFFLFFFPKCLMVQSSKASRAAQKNKKKTRIYIIKLQLCFCSVCAHPPRDRSCTTT